MRPISESNGYIDLTNGTSKDFNRIVKTFTRDIVDIYNISNDNNIKIKQNQDLVMQENMFLQRKIKELEEKMKTIEAKYDRNEYKICKTYYENSSINNNSAYHDTDYGFITLPYNDTQKTSINLYNKEFLLKNIDIEVMYDILNSEGVSVEDTKRILLKDDPGLINMIDNDENSFWAKTISTNKEARRINFKIIIKLPPKILTTRLINAVGIKPIPSYSLTLNNITYVDANNYNINVLPTYPTRKINNVSFPSSIDELENTKFIFSPIETTQIEFEMSQPYYIKAGNENKFTFGIKSIDIENINITSEQESYITEITIPGENRYFKRIFEPKAISAIKDADFGNLISYNLFLYDNFESPYTFGREIDANIRKVYIKTSIRRDGETIPTIKGLEFGYEPK